MRGTSHAGPRWLERVSGALQRRAGAVWRRLARSPRAVSPEGALRWLRECAGRDLGLSPTCGTTAVCPGLTAAAVPTLWNFGDSDQALAYARSLLALQRRDGSIPDAGLLHVSLFNTAQTIRAWRTLVDDGALPEALPALRKACSYLVSRIDDDGSLRIPTGGGAFERWAPAAVQLAGLVEIAAAARRFQMPQWRLAVVRAAERTARCEEFGFGKCASHVAAHGVEALLELGTIDPRCETLARRVLDQAEACVRSDGSLNVDLTHGWTSSAGLAHFAALWFRTGQRRIGNAAMQCLAAHQLPSGGWYGSWGRGAAFFPHGGSAWTAKYALDAARAQVEAAFAAAPNTLLEPLSAADERLRAVRRLAEETISRCGTTARIADVGCGSGRYLRELVETSPRLRLTGIDPSAALLEHLPERAAAVCGNLLRLPTDDESFDAAFCIEALEHALVPARAVDELCRVVRPGGRVVIVDKDARFQALSLSDPWEHWFGAQSLSLKLAEHCDDVRCEPLPMGPQQRTPGLFLCWSGTKRATASAIRLAGAA
ncbi:MAG: hypothetical protein C0483_25665 [Pirellula sp.]|nr:hypothetical protein [Pirellula sp.]